ncbi:hypothetical protein BDR05DRAFT_952562 [Suillus weaverae]|nr:hypothetical protein BDR05DRAFT_952562 [Suillus weaverae]
MTWGRNWGRIQQEGGINPGEGVNPVISGTKENVRRRPGSASIFMFATKEAAGGNTSRESAHWTKEINETIAGGQHYQCHFMWGKQIHYHTGVPQEQEFLRDQIAKEIQVGRYSSDFGTNLLPGMYTMPIHIVTKEGGKYRLVTNHSTGSFSLNSMIAKADIAGVTLNNVQHLGNALCQYRQQEGDGPLVIWKVDISEAYRHMPMHPLSQIKQIISFEEHDRAFYVKYQKFLPQNMVKLLHLWDELGIPHEEHKQLFSSPLPVIGFDVDAQLMRITLHDRLKLMSSPNCRCLHVINTEELYRSMKGKTQSKVLVWLNCQIVLEILWAAEHLEHSDGVYLLKSVSWNLCQIVHTPDVCALAGI